MHGTKAWVRRVIIFILFNLLSACSATGQKPVVDDRPPSTVDTFLDALKAKDYSAAAGHFDEKVRAALPAEALASMWTSQVEKLGQLQGWETKEKIPKDEYQVGIVALAFEKGRMRMTVTTEINSGKIAGIYFKPDTDRSVPTAETDPSLPSEKVEVGQQPYLLDGRIVYPKGKGPFPAAILVHGSGPNDMNATIGPNFPFRDIAEGLAVRGITVLRYNKRFFQYPQAATAATTVQDEVIDDAVAAVVLLKANPRVDPKRIFIIGHSLGAQLAPEIALRSKEVAGLVLLAPPGRTPGTILLEQLRYLGTPDDVVEKTKRDFQKVEAGQVEAVNILGAPGSYWKDLYARNGIEIARKLHKPVLILRGERDYQVVQADMEAWQRALKSENRLVAATVPNVNHLFIKGEGKPSPEEYNIPGQVEAGVMDRISDFIKNPPLERKTASP